MIPICIQMEKILMSYPRSTEIIDSTVKGRFKTFPKSVSLAEYLACTEI